MPLYLSKRSRACVFFSGSGSTLQALLDQTEFLNIVSVFSSKKIAMGLVRAKRCGVTTHVCKFPDDTEFVLKILNQQQIHTLFLAGFMKILSADFIHRFKAKNPRRQIFNIHPSLLPFYKGLAATESAYADGAALGVTIHNVVAEVDSGNWFKRTRSLSENQTRRIFQSEAHLWQRAAEQNILRTWGSCHQ